LGYPGVPWGTLGYLGVPWGTLGYPGEVGQSVCRMRSRVCFVPSEPEAATAPGRPAAGVVAQRADRGASETGTALREGTVRYPVLCSTLAVRVRRRRRGSRHQYRFWKYCVRRRGNARLCRTDVLVDVDGVLAYARLLQAALHSRATTRARNNPRARMDALRTHTQPHARARAHATLARPHAQVRAGAAAASATPVDPSARRAVTRRPRCESSPVSDGDFGTDAGAHRRDRRPAMHARRMGVQQVK
jgi:hypothetical protein